LKTAQAFAVATSGSLSKENEIIKPQQKVKFSIDSYSVPPNGTLNRVERIHSADSKVNLQKSKHDWIMANTAASIRVLNILRHWITKHLEVNFNQNFVYLFVCIKILVFLV
jgi:hypothetical protein